jgi:hypothetical protein
MAAPTIVQSVSQFNSTSGSPLVLPSPATAGNKIVHFYAVRIGNALAPTGSAPFTVIDHVDNPTFSDGCGWEWRTAVAGETTFVPFTGDVRGSNNTQHWLAEISTSTVDTFAQLVSTDPYNSNALTGAPVTPTASAAVLILGGASIYGHGPFTIAPDAGWTEDYDYNPGDHPWAWVAHQSVAGASGSYIPSGVASRNPMGDDGHGYAFITVAFAAAATPPPPPAPPDPGVWLDFDRDGFTSITTGSEAGYLAMEMPEGGATAVSDNITTDVISIDLTQGATAEVTGGSGTDSATIIVQNTDRKYTPDYTSSPIYGRCRPGTPVWIGVNEDGTLSGSGLTIYGLFAGRVREITPIAAGGDAAAPTAEILCDGILVTYQRSPVRFTDSLTRSQYDYRVAVLDAIDEASDRRDLDTEPDTLPLSSADSTDALSVLDALNAANGTRHFIAADESKDTWYQYTTRNRQYKFGSAADVSIDASSDHLTGIDGWRYNNDSLINHQRASIDPVNFPFAIAQVWTYDNVPFTLVGANKTIWANFDDYVRGPALVVTATGTAVTSTLTSFGRSAKIELFATNATITNIRITGQQVIREQGVSLTADDLASQGTYGLYAGSDLSSELHRLVASAQGIVDHHRLPPRRSAPQAAGDQRVTNWFPEMFSLRPYDQIAASVAAVSASAVKFEIVGRTLHCDLPTVRRLVNWQGTFQLAESRIQGRRRGSP